MKVICVISKKQYGTKKNYFNENKIYDVYLDNYTNRKIILDEFGAEWYFKYVSGYFASLSEIRKNKLLEIQKNSLSSPD
jgi:hypothetical protein